ncbi:HTR-like protein [Haloferax elongans ATCC BAA-1513]|uniref:histidine kinase n=1 Tax=Haloferax elongans ATCC BAA-1513 TaxID=1230453 RepID=M0HVT1_HALEO|nr:HTR-like protein [Haloferax elongans ATCC BAA-1513]
MDIDGTILYTNEAWKRFGTENDYAGDASSIGMNYLGVCDVDPDQSATAAGGGIRSVIDGTDDEFSYEYPCHSDNERRWFTMRVTRFEHEDETYVQVVHLDITDRKLAELEVDEKANRLQNVAGILSHDLRNPLSVALGYAKAVLDEGIATERIERIVSSLERMDDIISDALVLARHDTVETTSTVDLQTKAETAWSHVETGDVELAVADTMLFEADDSLLSHVFENLFRNAIEHARPEESDTNLTVTVGPLLEDPDGPGFYVEDDGVGIPERDSDEVFDAGYSVDSEGTGLGLSIVSQVAGAHGWCLELTESVSGGARFEITGVDRRAAE